MPELITPDVRVHASFVAAMQEFAAEGRGGPGDHSTVGGDLRERSARWTSTDGFAGYVADVVREGETETPLADGAVPCTTLWWVDGDEYLGRIAIRHTLTGWLREFGGHIGYDVRRSVRRRGHATAMLRAARPYALRLGIDPALITCDEDNLASRKVIETNGGVLEDVRTEAGHVPKLRYWMPTS